jgi:hypothetical protein
MEVCNKKVNGEYLLFVDFQQWIGDNNISGLPLLSN